MRIPDELIDDIRRANDIVDIVSAAVKLKRRGKNYIGLCPFHQEKTPSFNVNPEMQIFKCFGCGKGGNVFQFVMETERVSFVEAVRSLAEKAGIRIPEEGRDGKAEEESDRLYGALRFAGRVFYDNLTKTDEGRSAHEYFASRGFTEDTIRTFGLGYSLNSWDHLLNRAHAEGVQSDDLLAAGLVRKRDDGSFYDAFRGRAMFPIFTPSGRVAAFGARKMRDDDPIQGKYINSPETPVYSKSRILYGLSHSKEAIRQEDASVLVEGYADMISLFQAGVQNVVASSGTALTEEQLNLLGRYSKNLLLVYDGDSAGSQATIRGIDLALEQDFDLKVVALPSGEDPDSFIRKQGAKTFREHLSGAVSFIEFKASQYRALGLFNTPEGKTKAVRSIVQSIARVKDELKRTFYIKDVAERYNLYESLLLKELEQSTAKERRFSRPVPEPPSASLSEPQQVPEKPVGEIPAAERTVLRLFLEGHGDAIDFFLSNLHEEDVTDVRVREIIQRVLTDVEQKGRFDLPSAIDATDDPGLRELMMETVMIRYELSKAWEEKERQIEREDPMKVAHDAVAVLRRRTIQRAIDQNLRQLRAATESGADATPFLKAHQELLLTLKEIEQSTGKKPPSPASPEVL